MAGYNNMMGGGITTNVQPQPIQYPYGNLPSYDNYMGGQQQIRQMPNQFLKCRPVSSREEAMAFQIDLDGSLWVFPNVGNGKIYTKQVNNDGTATFSTYNLVKNENPYNSNQYVTKDEFNKVVQSIMAAIAPGSNLGNATVVNNNKDQNSMDF